MLYLPYEIWKDIPGYEGIYKISNMGNVISTRYHRTRILKPGMADGYSTYSLCMGGAVYPISGHRLVRLSFMGSIDYMTDGMCVCHKNDIRNDNRLCNLWIGTHKDNSMDCINKNRHISRYFHILKYKSVLRNVKDKVKRCLSSTLGSNMTRIYKYDKNMILLGSYESLSLASITSGVDRSDIHGCCSGKGKTAGGYKRSFNPI